MNQFSNKTKNFKCIIKLNIFLTKKYYKTTPIIRKNDICGGFSV